MEDHIKRNIDMIGQMLLHQVKKLGFINGDLSNYTMQAVQEEIQRSGLEMDIDRILLEKHPIACLVETFHFSGEAIELFTEIVMHSDANENTKQQLLRDAISYHDQKGHYSFSLHSYTNY